MVTKKKFSWHWHLRDPFTITNNENCLLVPPSDPQSLAKSILNLLEDPIKCQKLAKSGFELVNKEGNLKSMSDSVLSVYEETIQLKNHKNGENS